MFERIEAGQNLVAVKLGQSVSADEIDAMYADIEAAFRSSPRLNYYVDALDWSFMGADAALQNLKTKVKASDWLTKFDRIAIVTDNFFLKGLITMGSMMMPGIEIRVFAGSDSIAAFEWANKPVVAAELAI